MPMAACEKSIEATIQEGRRTKKLAYHGRPVKSMAHQRSERERPDPTSRKSKEFRAKFRTLFRSSRLLFESVATLASRFSTTQTWRKLLFLRILTFHKSNKGKYCVIRGNFILQLSMNVCSSAASVAKGAVTLELSALVGDRSFVNSHEDCYLLGWCSRRIYCGAFH